VGKISWAFCPGHSALGILLWAFCPKTLGNRGDTAYTLKRLWNRYIVPFGVIRVFVVKKVKSFCCYEKKPFTGKHIYFRQAV
jgi:hypothetical protein